MSAGRRFGVFGDNGSRLGREKVSVDLLEKKPQEEVDPAKQGCGDGTLGDEQRHYKRDESGGEQQQYDDKGRPHHPVSLKDLVGLKLSRRKTEWSLGHQLTGRRPSCVGQQSGDRLPQ